MNRIGRRTILAMLLIVALEFVASMICSYLNGIERQMLDRSPLLIRVRLRPFITQSACSPTGFRVKLSGSSEESIPARARYSCKTMAVRRA